ncbi:MAG: hypothetical protein IKA71_07980 [Lentisphaeria bacterium]|nr:hypothetical protein [Lentisphaeria bacterium]
MLVRILAYFVPFAINFLSGGFFFITAYRFSEAGCSRTVISSSIVAWGVAYCLLTALVGKLASVKNALPFILAGGVTLSLTSVGFIVFDALYMQFLWLILAGFGAALFCTPFQLLAKDIESGSKKGVVSATAFYTLTWSAGLASGPLAFARFSLRQGFVITLILSLAVTLSVVLIALLRPRGGSANAETGKSVHEVIFPEKTYDKLAILGWIVGGLGTVTVCQIRALWPKLGLDLDIPQHHNAYILAVVSYVQAIVAVMLCRSKSWMWRRLPAVLMGGCGIVTLLAFAFAALISRHVAVFYLIAGAYGVYSGCFYFYLVYHSLAHPTRSGFFVTGNEIIVGVTSIVAPLLGGMLADICGYTEAAFVFAAVVALAAFIAQWYMLDPVKLATGDK